VRSTFGIGQRHMQRSTTPRREPLDHEVSVADFIDSIDQRQGKHLRALLIIGDAVALGVAIVTVLFLGTFRDEQGLTSTGQASMVFIAAGLWTMRSQGLWLARVSAIRVVEITRISRALALTFGAMLVFDRVIHFGLYVRHLSAAAIVGWVLVVTWRSIYRTWLSSARSRDLYCRRVITVGTDDETTRLIAMFTTHPELGVRVAGVIGHRDQAEALGSASLWLGTSNDAERIVEAAHVSGVIVSSMGITGRRLNELIRHFQSRGVHVHIATGIAGIDARRMRSLPLGHEPLLYIEAPSLGKAQRIGKRLFDTASATVALVLTSPLWIAIAIAVKVNDGGPVFFRQERIGLGGATFGVYKFRTMMVDAEAQLATLAGVNERRGPLFKMENDPRVTRVGRFLRSTSLDELPQLLNVLRGEMSLVGPRPALPKEVAEFSPELRNRESVVPGITGLWQVEARDNPSFEAYRRLDLFYVENWSITLDLMIILGTLEQLVAKVITTVRPRRDPLAATAIPALVEAGLPAGPQPT
jgi:exopolysaccharide biosynthesis polyprenyl glycosylphosphotransferase